MSNKDTGVRAAASQRENIQYPRIYKSSGDIRNFFTPCAKVKYNIH